MDCDARRSVHGPCRHGTQEGMPTSWMHPPTCITKVSSGENWILSDGPKLKADFRYTTSTPSFHGGLFRQALMGADGLHGTDMGSDNQEKKGNGLFEVSASRGVRKVVICPPPPFDEKNCKIFLLKNGQNQGLDRRVPFATAPAPRPGVRGAHTTPPPTHPALGNFAPDVTEE